MSPLIVKSPAIVTSFGKPTVIVPEFSPTVTSFDVPENVIVPPKETAVVVEPSETVIELFESLLFAIDPANIPFVTEVFAIVTAPALVIVTSPDKAAAVKPVPSPINICVFVTAFADKTPELFASLTITVLAAALAIFANVTFASVIFAVVIASDCISAVSTVSLGKDGT